MKADSSPRALDSVSVRSHWSEAQESTVLTRRCFGFFSSGESYRAVRAANPDIWLGRCGRLTRPQGFEGLDRQMSWLPLRMRLSGVSVGVRSGSVAHHDLRDAFHYLGAPGCQSKALIDNMLLGKDEQAWTSLLSLVRYGLVDMRESTRVALPAGAALASPRFGANCASYIHAMAISGMTLPANWPDEGFHGTPTATVSLGRRFRDLREAGVNFNYRDSLGRAPLHYAAMGNNVQAIRGLFTAGADLNARDGEGDTPLVSAIKFGAVDAIEYLLRKGADPFIRCMGPHTKREIRIYREFIPGRAAKREIRVEAVPRIRNKDEWAPIHWAVALTHPSSVEAVRLLLSAARNYTSREARDYANARTGVSGSSPLHISIRAGDPEKVRYLLEAGANPNLVSRDRNHPMQVAAAWGGSAVMKQLIEAGGEVNHHEKPGNTMGRVMSPLDTAIRFRNEDCAVMLLKAGAHQSVERMAKAVKAGMVHAFDLMTEGPTPEGRRRAAQVTRENPGRGTYDGWGMLHYAAFAPTPEIVRHLVRNYQLELNVRAPRGDTPISLAEHLDVWKAMLELGANYQRWRYEYNPGGI